MDSKTIGFDSLKIGILTFHWAANHGAVLQTYASYSFLKTNFDIEDIKVIDYLPHKREITLRNALRPHYPSVIISRINTWIKENKIKSFREKLSFSKRYYSNQELIDNPPEFDILFCGSDQIWNPSYAKSGEGKPTPVYFLNFGKAGCKKIALSVSFGCIEYPTDVMNIVAPHIKKLNAISVRENSGLEILQKLGVEKAVITADPTSLLSTKEYQELCAEKVFSKTPYIGLCILRKQAKQTKKLIKSITSKFDEKVIDIEKMSMENWLAGIRDAKVVVTNSFHCVMMCLKLHTPFVVVTENGSLSGMNDRLYTLLEKFNLQDRIIHYENQAIIFNEIDWKEIDEIMESYALTLKNYLSSVIDL